ncbi:hypothetical protein, partial [Candidatus Methylomirabilis sp.]|uniref:hypothetical protein n=1 Tax=Candidatus Methylomirabilis sp. TaxID=2032687 RepID=UPI002A5F022B|nr:hypothetical protein [Candidatus Methylomirabilis sp.]
RGTGSWSGTVLAESHTVSFGTIAGYTTPPPQTVTVNADQTTSVTGMYSSTQPTAAVVLNEVAFRRTQTIVYQATLTPGSMPPTPVDIYLFARLPDGITFVSLVQASPGGAISMVLGPSPIPFLTGATLSSMTVPFAYTFTGSEPVGAYLAYAGLVTAGTDPLQPTIWLSLDQQPFWFTP